VQFGLAGTNARAAPPSARKVGYGAPSRRAQAASSAAPSSRTMIHSKVAMAQSLSFSFTGPSSLRRRSACRRAKRERLVPKARSCVDDQVVERTADAPSGSGRLGCPWHVEPASQRATKHAKARQEHPCGRRLRNGNNGTVDLPTDRERMLPTRSGE